MNTLPWIIFMTNDIIRNMTLYHGLAIYKYATFVNVTSVAENTE